MIERMAGTTGFEPATSDVTGRRSNQLNYVPAMSREYYDASTGTLAATNFAHISASDPPALQVRIHANPRAPRQIMRTRAPSHT